MRLPRLRRRWVALAIVVVLVALSVRALDSTLSIDSYRVVDDRTLAVRIGEGPGAWTRITNIAETPSTVSVTVSSFYFRPGPGTDEAIPVDLTVTLHDRIGTRTVIDGSTGLAVPRSP